VNVIVSKSIGQWNVNDLLSFIDLDMHLTNHMVTQSFPFSSRKRKPLFI